MLDQYMSKKPGYRQPILNTRVVSISALFIEPRAESASASSANRTANGGTQNPVTAVDVYLADGTKRQYAHVITTTTLPCLRTMNLTQAKLDWQQKEALRMLQYGPSTKIGVRFSRRWWEDDKWMKQAGAYGAILGGQSYTDNMSRTVVYPSYGIEQPESGACMIVSYAWTNDALALTALMGPESRGVLKQRILEDLVQIHSFTPSAATELDAMWEDMHPYSWSTDPHTMGESMFSRVTCCVWTGADWHQEHLLSSGPATSGSSTPP